MKKISLLLLVLACGAASGHAQVLRSVASSYNNTWGIGINVGNTFSLGREFYRYDNYGHSTQVMPDGYRQQLSPTYGLELWREGYTEPWFWGGMLAVNYASSNYAANFTTADASNPAATDGTQSFGMNGNAKFWDNYLGVYVGYRFGEKLSVRLGVADEMTNPTLLNVFATRHGIALLAIARYSISDSFYASARLMGGLPILRWSGYDNDYYFDGIYASERNLCLITANVGIGFSF